MKTLQCTMTSLTYSQVRVTGAIMLNHHVYAELIWDRIHISYLATQILLKKKIVLITDFVQTEGLYDDVHNLSMGTAYVKDYQARWEDRT